MNEFIPCLSYFSKSFSVYIEFPLNFILLLCPNTNALPPILPSLEKNEIKTDFHSIRNPSNRINVFSVRPYETNSLHHPHDPPLNLASYVFPV